MARVEPVVALIFLAAVALAVAFVLSRRAAARHRVARREEDARLLKMQSMAMVSHELRTPLTSIAGFAETLIAGWRHLSPEEVDEFLGIIAGQARHLGELVEDVLLIPLLEAGQLQLKLSRFDFAELAREVAAVSLPVSADPDAVVAIPPGIIVYADRTRVHQILRNLLDNAVRYGGDEILIEGAEQRDKFVVSVSDDGPGVDAADRQRIFEHFEQARGEVGRREMGVGLGLPIARHLARAMGGDLWYEARFPTGSTFLFTLPRRGPESGSGDHPDVSPGAGSPG